jgi:hypothetical protein
VGIDQDAFFVDPDIEKLESGISLSDFEKKQIREADEKQRLMDEHMPLAPEGFFDGTTPATPATPALPPIPRPSEEESGAERAFPTLGKELEARATQVSKSIFGGSTVIIKGGITYEGKADPEYMMQELSKVMGEEDGWDNITKWNDKPIRIIKTRIWDKEGQRKKSTAGRGSRFETVPNDAGYVTQNRKIDFSKLSRAEYNRMINAIKAWRIEDKKQFGR